MNFIPYDQLCFEELRSEFGDIFEDRLVDEICQFGKFYSFSAEDIIMERGDRITHMPLVLEGSLKVMAVDAQEENLLLYFLERSDTCAITLNCCTTSQRSTIKAVAETDCRLVMIPVVKMEDWMVKYNSWRNYVLESYNSRFNEMLDAFDSVVFNSLEERLKEYLEKKSRFNHGDQLNISHAQIASELHTSRVVISRLMKKLVRQGVITQNRNKVTYLNN